MPETFQEKQLAAIKALETSFQRGDSTSSVVPMMQNHSSDGRLCLTSMVFLPPDVGALIEQKVISHLQQTDENQYFYPLASLHVTIQNVRSISDPPNFNESVIEVARACFEKVASRARPFSFDIRRIFELPTSLALCAFSDDRLQTLVHLLRDELRNNGIADDKRYGSNDTSFGNVTFCRFSQPPSPELQAAVSALKNIEIGPVTVDSFTLVTTNAVCHPAKTRVIERFPLKG